MFKKKIQIMSFQATEYARMSGIYITDSKIKARLYGRNLRVFPHYSVDYTTAYFSQLRPQQAVITQNVSQLKPQLAEVSRRVVNA